jgi:hypothetical protein
VSEEVVDKSAVVPAGVTIEPTFAVLFSTRLRGGFEGFGDLPAGIVPLPSERSEGYVALLGEFELRLLGKAFLEAERMTRWTCGRIALDGLPEDAPAYADVYLLAHKSGCALWEVWLPAPAQPLDAARWVRWLDPQADDGPVARLWRVLAPLNDQVAGEARSPGPTFRSASCARRASRCGRSPSATGPISFSCCFSTRRHGRSSRIWWPRSWRATTAAGRVA